MTNFLLTLLTHPFGFIVRRIMGDNVKNAILDAIRNALYVTLNIPDPGQSGMEIFHFELDSPVRIDYGGLAVDLQVVPGPWTNRKLQ